MDSTRKLLNAIKQSNNTGKETPSQVVNLKIKTLSPLVFTYNEKLTIDSQFYTLDNNFSTTNLWNGSSYYDLHVGDTVKAIMMNNAQTYYVLGNKSGGGRRWWHF